MTGAAAFRGGMANEESLFDLVIIYSFPTKPYHVAAGPQDKRCQSKIIGHHYITGIAMIIYVIIRTVCAI
jgi:hypothetical protein